jgi:hypothetical protein
MTNRARSVAALRFGSVSMLPSGESHTFAKAASLDKVPLQAAQLSIEQVVRLVNQADDLRV